MKKREKEKLHEDDRFLQFVRGLWQKATTRRRLFNLTVTLAVCTLIAVAVIAIVHESKIESRRAAIDRAQTIDEMAKAAERYTDVRLQMRLGIGYWERGEQGDTERAAEAFSRALQAARNGHERGLASLALAKAKMNLGQHEEAYKLFDAAARISETGLLIGDEANWYAGRCLELMNKPEDARERYRRIELRKGAETTWVLLARYRQTQMRRKLLD